MAECLTEEQLSKFHAGELPESEVETAQAHIRSCSACMTLSEDLLKSHDALVAQMRALRRSGVFKLEREDAATVVIPDSHGGAVQVDNPDSRRNPPGRNDIGHPRIAGYEIVREVHRGGQGVIYQAVQLSTKRKVAIKVLLHGQFASKAARRRFEREVELASALKHPNIISVFDSNILADGQPYYVMDYVRGAPLDVFVKEKQLKLQETLELMVTVCEAVSYAHQKGVIHRDLKPSNILVERDGQPRLLDFGLAKMLFSTTETMVSMTGEISGTLQYMSPEQARGTPDEVDIRSDVYSLGVIFYQALTGEFPYPVTESLNKVLNHIVTTAPNPPSKSWKSGLGVSRSVKGRIIQECPIDKDLETILLKALSKERERRYQSAGELAQDIQRYLKNEPIEARRDSGWYVARKFFSRYRVPVMSTGVLLLILTVTTVKLKVLSDQLTQETDRARQAYKQFFESIRDGVVTFSTENARITDVNQSMSDLFGFNKEEFLKMTIKDFSAEREETDENFRLLQDGYFIKVPARKFLKKDGTTFPGEVRSAKLAFGGRSYFLGVIRRISDEDYERLKDKPTEFSLLPALPNSSR